MKRFRISILITLFILMVFLIYSSAFAVGTVVFSPAPVVIEVAGQKRVIITLAWTADAGDATVPSTTIQGSLIKGYFLYSIQTDPGVGPPTTLYDIIINDANGADIAGGLLADRSSTVTQIVNLGASTSGYPIIRGDLTFTLSNNSQNSAAGVCILIFVTN